MSDFKPGDVVVCVDDTPHPEWVRYLNDSMYTARYGIRKGMLYRVVGTGLDDGEVMLSLDGIASPAGAWPSWRFRKLNDEPDDIALIERIKACKPIKVPAVEELRAIRSIKVA